MAEQVVVVGDPGIDTAFAMTLALLDPNLDVIGLSACAGNVTADQATCNVQILVEQIDPPRLPRTGAALPVEYEVDNTRLHGPTGLGGTSFPCAQLHHQHTGDKLISDLVRQNPKGVTVVVLGPLTMLAAAIDREPELPALVKRIVCMGGSWHEPGNVTAAAEFHFFCDPLAARHVVRSGAPITLVPLDASRKLLYAPNELLELPAPESRACRFLRQIVPFGIAATCNLYGIEGFHLDDVLGIAAVALPEAVATRGMAVDVETRGEVTRGMSVFDLRRERQPKPNVDLVVEVDVPMVRAYIAHVLGQD
jgi:inosine-uridine nucleoside N-ribohydrolase